MRHLMPDFLNQLTQHRGYQFKAHLPLTWSAAASQHFCKSDSRVSNDASQKRSHRWSQEKCLVHRTCSIRIYWQRHWAKPAFQCTVQLSLHQDGTALCPAISSYIQHRPLVHSTHPHFILLTAPLFLIFFLIICLKKQLATHIHYSFFPLWCFHSVCSFICKGHFRWLHQGCTSYSKSLTFQI